MVKIVNICNFNVLMYYIKIQVLLPSATIKLIFHECFDLLKLTLYKLYSKPLNPVKTAVSVSYFFYYSM